MVPSKKGSQCENIEMRFRTLSGSGFVKLIIQRPSATAKLRIAATTGWLVKQDTKSPMAENVAPSRLIPKTHENNKPKSNAPPGKTERHIRKVIKNIISRKSTVAKNFPRIICVIDSGADIKKIIV